MNELTLSLLLICLAAGTLFSSLHAALADLSRAALEDLAERRRGSSRRKARVAAINADVAGHARSVALVRIFCNLATSVIAVQLVAQVRGSSGLGWIDGIAAVVVTAMLVWLCNVLLADSLAKHLGERLVYMFTRLIRVLHLVQRPFAPVSSVVDGVVRVATGAKQMNKAQEIEQELLDAVEEGEREGQIDEREREMIEAVVNFKSRTVEQIMTPRNEIEALQLTNNLGAITAFVRKARHSRIPVYKENLDDIVGFFYVKDLLQWLAGGGSRVAGSGAGGFELKALLRPAMMVPETKTIRALAEEFVEKKVHVAVVADEYGGTAGIVSLEDIVEEVFGDIQDEYERAEDDPPKIDVRVEEDGAGVAEIDGRAYISDVNAALKPLGVEVPESDEYDTLGGFVLSTLGRIPAQNESFTHVVAADGESGGQQADAEGETAGNAGERRRQMVVTVLEATPMKVVRVRILVKPERGAETKPEVVTDARLGEAERV